MKIIDCDLILPHIAIIARAFVTKPIYLLYIHSPMYLQRRGIENARTNAAEIASVTARTADSEYTLSYVFWLKRIFARAKNNGPNTDVLYA